MSQQTVPMQLPFAINAEWRVSVGNNEGTHVGHNVFCWDFVVRTGNSKGEPVYSTAPPSSLYTRETMLRSPRMRILLSIFLFALNAFICRELFVNTYIDAFVSVEGSFIALSRWILANPRDLLWFPYWFGGMPWIDIYQPGFHAAVAALAAAFHLNPALAYHALCAFVYCIGPVTLFLMSQSMTGRTGFAFLAALLYSTFSPSVLFPMVTRDISNPFWPRRLQAITAYGEGPHIAVMALLPVVILLFHWVFTRRGRLAVGLAPLAVAACLLTNWPGTIGLAIALCAYILAYAAWDRAWLSVLAVGAFAYGIAWPWMPLSTLKTVISAAQNANGRFPFSGAHLLFLVVFLALLPAAEYGARRLGVPDFLRFAVWFTMLPAVIYLVWDLRQFALLPQPHRWLLEFEMGFVCAIVFAGCAVGSYWPAWQKPLLALLLLFCSVQVFVFRDHAREKVAAAAIGEQAEYRVARWFDGHMQGRRVFAPGSISLWMNAFTDTPQFAGCCDQGVTNLQYRYALHAIYTGENAGAEDGRKAALWLKVFGVHAVAVSGAGSQERFKPFANPRKFDGVLPLLWSEKGDTVYEIPQRSASLAHALPRTSLVNRAPLHGADTDSLMAYAAALDDTSLPPFTFTWRSRHAALITGALRTGQVISVQEGYHPNWRATANGAPAAVSRDALGMIVIEPRCDGPCSVELAYERGPEATAAPFAAGFCLIGPLLFVLLRSGDRMRRRAER